MKILNLKIDPYRAMFPIGLFLGVCGVGTWLLYGFNLTRRYPSNYHATIMMGGFLFLIAVGFLMTALPAFTDTESATTLEMGAAILISLGLAVAGISDQPVIFHLLVLAQMILLILFGVRRVLKRKNDPPPTFVFVAFGILCGISGISIICSEDIGYLSGNWSILGHNLFFQGMMLSLVLGVGSRLLPSLMGWEELPLIQISTRNFKEKKTKFLNFQMLLLLGLTALLGFSFFIEAFFNLQIGRILRALVSTIVSFRFWKLHKFPFERTWLAKWLWISGWCVVIGLWGYALFLSYAIHLLHITLIGGFSLMTLMIATRVTLAHGDHGYDLEGSSRALKWAGILILAAMLTRVLAPFTKDAYRTHLGYASLVWILAIIFWTWAFIRKIFVLSKKVSP